VPAFIENGCCCLLSFPKNCKSLSCHWDYRLGKRLLYEADHVEPIRGIQRSVVASATVSGVLGEAVPKLACMCRWRAQDWAAVVALKDELGPFSFVFVTFRWKITYCSK
jgi:hypothetical protein